MRIIEKKTRLKKKHEGKKIEHFCALDHVYCHEWRFVHLIRGFLGIV
jgi:hypothetical protein